MWGISLSSDELANVPDRFDPMYLGLCEKTICELKQKLEEKNDLEKVQAAEDEISNLMAQLSVRPKSRSVSGPNANLHHNMQRSPSQSHTGPGDGGTQWGNQDGNGALFIRSVVEQGDSKDYLGKLRPEVHLVPPKHYEAMNFRELMLGMAHVHHHLVQNGCPTHGYELHTMFILRKSVSFLYTNSASVLYEKYVTDKVVSGEFLDYPSSCSDAALEFFCDTYRRQECTSSGNGRSQQKPWSGYPYRYCYFYNEGAGCHKKSCQLKHECGFCHLADHRSKDCAKST